MYECRTNYPESKKYKKVHCKKEARNPEGVGAIWKRDSGRRKVSDSSGRSLALEKGIGARSRDYSEGQESQGRSPDKKIREREPIPQGGPCLSEQGTDDFKKRDKLGLTNRVKDQQLSQEQHERIMEEVLGARDQGIPKFRILGQLGICRSTYYSWRNVSETKMRKDPPNRLLSDEKEAVVNLNRKKPYLSHRKISGFIRKNNLFISPSSCY